MKILNRSSLRSLYLFAGTLSIGAALPVSTSYGQTAEPDIETVALEEIVVTAERRPSDVQRTAASVSVRTGDELLGQGKFLLKSILEDVPGVVGGAAESTGSTAGGGTDTIGAGITIRGVQSNQGGGGSIVSTAASTAVYVDGVYEGVGGAYDIDHVEVLRGPQGTLYGRSATGGVVAIHTRNPELDKVGGNAVVEAGNYGLQHYTATLNLPIVSDVLALRVSGNQYQRDGFHTEDGLGARESTDGKIKLLYRPNEALSILVGAALQNNEDHTGGLVATAYPANPDDVSYAETPKGTGKNRFRQYWSEINLDLGAATLTYQPAYRTWEQDSLIVANGPPGIVINQTQYTPTDRFLTHELRLTSNPDSKLIWQVGGLYYDNHVVNSNTVELLTGALAFSAETDKTTKAAGAFAQATYPFTDASRVTAGVRYDNTKVTTIEDYTAGNLSTQSIGAEEGTRKFNNWTYKLRGEHDLTPTNLVYAQISTGVSPGEVTATTCAGGDACAVVLEAETLTSYEVGSKNRFLDDSLQLNGAVYYYRYGGFQTAGIDVSGNGTSQFATLVSPARMYGAELELLYQFTVDDRVGLNVAYTEAKYVDQPADFKKYIVKDHIAGVAPFTVNGSYTHQWHLPGDSTLSFSADGRYLSTHDEGIISEEQRDQGGEKLARVKGQFVGDLSANWSSAGNRFSATGYVRNVTDNQYATNTRLTQNTFGELISNLVEYDPRTYGVVLSVNF